MYTSTTCYFALLQSLFVLWSRADVLRHIHEQHPHLAVSAFDEVRSYCVLTIINRNA